ncbi:MAG: hypothetical protein CMM18_06150 [Rhodospirillaceae bacterium]|nr:hypothetical protein [Rhodospirillaceae bacterium]
MTNLLALTLHIFLLGAMVTFIVVTTPTVFITLDQQSSQKFLRSIFPRLFKYCLVLVLTAGILFIIGKSFYGSIISIISACGFLVNTYIVTPRINKLRDLSIENDIIAKKSFKLMHLVSVLVFLFQILGSISILILYSLNHILFFFKNI